MQKHNKNLITTVIVHIFSYVLIYLVNLIMAKLLAPLAYGDMNIIIRTLMLTSVICLLGSDLGARKFLARYIVNHENDLFYGYLQWSKSILIKMTLLIITIASCLILIASILHWFNMIALHRWHPLVYALYLTPIVMFSTLLSAILNSIGRFLLYLIPEVILKHLLFLIIILVMHYSLDQITLYHMIIALGLERTIILAIQLISVSITLPKLTHETPEQKKWSKETLPMMQAEFLHICLIVIDVLMVELLSPNENDVGFYAAISTIAHSILIFNSLFFPVLAPLICPLFERGQNKKLQLIIRSQNALKLVCLLIINLIIIIFGKKLLSQFGQLYVSAYVPMILLALGFSIITLTDSAKHLMTYCGFEKSTMKIQLIYLILSIVLHAIFIPIYGVLGAAIATIITATSIRTFMVYMAKKKLGIGLF
jgi:O-antigen/teichoic acid export membrane protein